MWCFLQVCAGVQPCAHVHVEARGEYKVFFSINFHIPPLMQGLSRNQHSPSIAMSPIALGYRYTAMSSFLREVLRNELGSICLHNKHSSTEAISLAPAVLFQCMLSDGKSREDTYNCMRLPDKHPNIRLQQDMRKPCNPTWKTQRASWRR